MSARFHNPMVSIEAKTLRHMRLSKKASLNQAGRTLRITGSAIAHFEQGRTELSQARIETMVEAYGYTMDQFYEFLDGKQIPMNYRDECFILIRKLDEAQLPMIHALLQNLALQAPPKASVSESMPERSRRALTKVNLSVKVGGRS